MSALNLQTVYFHSIHSFAAFLSRADLIMSLCLLALCLLARLLVSLVSAQLSGSVGPLTSSAIKAATRTCSILDYGAIADGKTDISSAITSAFADCKSGGILVIQSGFYALSNWVTLSCCIGWARHIECTFIRTGPDGGNMIYI